LKTTWITRRRRFAVFERSILDLRAPHQYEHAAPDEHEAVERIADALVKKDKAAHDASAAAVGPVKHVIKIEPL
jgi:hypothetical protein